MARIAVMIQSVTVDGNSLPIGHDPKERDGFLLEDVDKKQQLVDQTINPPGQERYLLPVDRKDLLSFLDGLSSNDVTEAEIDAILADTRGGGSDNSVIGNYDGTTSPGSGDDISVSNVQATLDHLTGISGTTTDEAETFRDKISFKFVETGDFQLSYDNGILSELMNQNWVKVFPNDASGLYSP
jgi:hypothetical protein